jgi:hypothetical protein
VVSLLTWWQHSTRRLIGEHPREGRDYGPDPTEAISRYHAFLLNRTNSKAYGVLELTRTTGFVALEVADAIQYGVTFGPAKNRGLVHGK